MNKEIFLGSLLIVFGIVIITTSNIKNELGLLKIIIYPLHILLCSSYLAVSIRLLSGLKYEVLETVNYGKEIFHNAIYIGDI